jgi:glyoxylase-like metal-dependent hydrolase (beta-lactamase superfamily II)
MPSIARRLVPALACFAFAAALDAQAPDWSKVEVKAQKVAGNIWMLSTDMGGNIGVSAGADGILLVDDQFEPLVPKIEAALKEVSAKPVRFVLNTHFHGDHTHGNKAFGQKATIVAHDNVRKRMAADTEFDQQPNTPPPAHALPIVTFDSGVTVHFNGEAIRGLHIPAGHTDGDTVVFFTGSKVVHMGDDYFNGMFPFIDLESGGTVAGYIAAIEKVLPEITDETKIIPGHGPLASKADLAAYVGVLKETVAVVRKGIAEGKSLDQLKAAKVLAAWDRFSWAFISTDKYLETVYADLTKKQAQK